MERDTFKLCKGEAKASWNRDRSQRRFYGFEEEKAKGMMVHVLERGGSSFYERQGKI